MSTKPFVYWIGAFFFIFLFFYSYSFEPYWLEENHYSIEFKPPAQSQVLTVAHLTDLHTQGFGRLEKKLIESLKKQEPDLIVITGDIVSQNGTHKGYQKVLSKLKAPLGVYFVQGNWEHWHPIHEMEKLFEKQDIHLLNNKNVEVAPGLTLVGFDDAPTGHPDIEKALKNIPKENFVIGLFHSPAFFNQIKDKVDLALSGHTHGGQVRAPLWGALWLPQGAGSFSQGWYEDESAKMYISRGLGTTIFPVRFLARPEVVYFHLKPKEQKIHQASK